MAGLLALSAASIADAQTVVHITGSTAFRAATVTAITHILQPGFTYGYAGSSFTGANQAIFTGHTITNNISVIIKTSWSGSVGGVQTVSQQLPVSTWLTNTTPQSTGGTSGAPAVYDPPAVPEVCMSDVYQSSTPYATPALTESIVGIVPFEFVRNNGAPATLTNLTPNLAQAMWLNGSLPLALFTGSPSDEGTRVFATGRDADSGTRMTAFAETGVGVFTAVEQYVPTNSSGAIISRTAAGPVAGQKFYPAETINGIFYDVGQGGYSSGGDLAVAMEQTTGAALGGYYVTYLGLSDANTAISGGAAPIMWNGVAYSPTAVEEGQYTFWGYEHLDYRSNYGTLDANGQAVADQLAGQILGTDAVASSGLLLSSMRVSRPTDGGLVTPNY